MALVTVFMLVFLISLCKSDDQLTPAKPLYPGDTLISDGGVFALGFFSPTKSNATLYVGIWYHNISQRTVVWVANRDNPITAPSSAMLFISNSSELVLSESGGHTLWKARNNISTGGSGATVVLLNSGNLMLRFPNGTVLWQSFDHLTDTILPGMKLLLKYNGQVAQRIFSWKGPDDPSTGNFSLSGDPESDLQIFLWNGTSPYWRSGAWNGALVSAMYQSNTSTIMYQTIINKGNSIYMMYSVSDDSPSMRLTLDYTGALRMLIWNSNLFAWSVLINGPTYACGSYASCGPFGYCDASEAFPSCKCLDGFKPDGLNISRGCVRKEKMKCSYGDSFLTMSGMKTPDKFLYIRNRSFDECMEECRRNCSCTAYAYANLSSAIMMGDTSRCLIWIRELVDMTKISGGGENLYLRLPNSNAVKKESDVLKIVLPVIASLLIFTCICVVWICKSRGKRQRKEIQNKFMVQYLSASNELRDENVDFPFVVFEDVVTATDNFSHYNMLGKGGFGKVYKGILEGGKEVAVKRLSKDSGQGIEEFRNEVVLIARLQHRNLVKLVGCCIHEDEKLLIYEYLPNKSLDAFLFDASRKTVLDWPKRFKIIKGVARGLLYLHQDSRLTIIHRDLKAGNILLDAEMSPKISDFGMARIFGGNQQQENTTRVVGTYGYMSPEYAMEGVFSVKSDIYSFGILLLEIISGFRISSPHLIIGFPNLIAYSWSLWKDGNARDLVDSSIVEGFPLHEVLRCIHIALLCIQDHPDDRPLMSSVVFMLENNTAPLPQPKQPIYFLQKNRPIEDARENMENSVNGVSITALEGR
uniref:Receptor-like serine/threonine-protein kinase n=1 Tax=Leersia perrieri TaxID=77586 RepID=A0A0D9W9Y8_9ORYZ